MRESKSERLEKQRERQAAYRDEQKKEKRPDRDDIARVAFHWLILSIDSRMQETGDASEKHEFEDAMIQRLEVQGFAPKASEEALDGFFRKYVKDGWNFQRKPHLNRSNDD